MGDHFSKGCSTRLRILRLDLSGGPNFLVFVVHRVVPAKLAIRKSDGLVLSGKSERRFPDRVMLRRIPQHA
jgi:hypothetical protein